jgi:hypothetical protein
MEKIGSAIDKLHNFYSTLKHMANNAVRTQNKLRILLVICNGKRSVQRPTCIWEDDIKMVGEERVCVKVDYSCVF